MEREQIIKALECCVKVGGYRDAQICNDCPLTEKRCAILLPENALSLITSQEQRIKELTEENKKLEYTLEGVMHFVDKWLDGAELEKDEVNRAITMREKTLQIVENLTEENERLRAEVSVKKKLLDKCVDLEDKVKADTVRKMQDKVRKKIKKTEWLNGRAVYLEIDKITKEMLEGL